jgi:hypothetical protein
VSDDPIRGSVVAITGRGEEPSPRGTPGWAMFVESAGR